MVETLLILLGLGFFVLDTALAFISSSSFGLHTISKLRSASSLRYSLGLVVIFVVQLYYVDHVGLEHLSKAWWWTLLLLPIPVYFLPFFSTFMRQITIVAILSAHSLLMIIADTGISNAIAKHPQMV